MDTLQALDNFWNGFDWPAYDESTVPDEAQLPYITYEGSSDFFGRPIAQTISLWDRSYSWKAVTEKEQEIAARIGRGGVQIPCDGGVIWIKRGAPWAQRVPSDPDIRRIAINLEVEFIV